MTAVRLGVSALLALVITLSLFWVMDYLISGRHNLGDRGDDLGAIRFQPVEPPDELDVKDRRKPEPPPPPKEPPPPPKLEVEQIQQVQTPLPNLDVPKLDVPLSGSGPFLGGVAAASQQGEGDIIPLVRIQPQYPRRAAIARQEGYVTIEFTITPTGTVTDPTVVDSKPPRVFDREAIRAILKWKFKPRIVNGEAVSRRATQTLEFNLEDV